MLYVFLYVIVVFLMMIGLIRSAIFLISTLKYHHEDIETDSDHPPLVIDISLFRSLGSLVSSSIEFLKNFLKIIRPNIEIEWVRLNVLDEEDKPVEPEKEIEIEK